MQDTAVDKNQSEEFNNSLRKVGWGLIAVGAVSFLINLYILMVHPPGPDKQISMNFILVWLAGILLLMKKMWIVRPIAWCSAFSFAFFLAGILGLLLLMPWKVLIIYLYIRGSQGLTLDLFYYGGLLGFLWWVHKSLDTDAIWAALQTRNPNKKRNTNWLRSGFGVATICMLTLYAYFAYLPYSTVGAEALERVKKYQGDRYSYWLNHITVNVVDGERKYNVHIVAYTGNELKNFNVNIDPKNIAKQTS